MNKIRNFTAKKFLILLGVVCIGCICVFLIKFLHEKDKFNKKINEVDDNPMIIYENGKKANYNDILDLYNWDASDINLVVFGLYNKETKEFDNYYIDNAQVMDEIIDLLKDIELVGSEDKVADIMTGKLWKIRIFNPNYEHSIDFASESCEYDNAQVVNITASASYYEGIIKSEIDTNDLVGKYSIVYDEDIKNKLQDIYDKYIHNISIDKVIENKQNKSFEYKDYFSYAHTFLETDTALHECGEEFLVIKYKFPIQDSTCYLLVERYNTIGGSIDNKYTNINIREVKIVNQAGEEMNLFDCTIEELQNFIK